MKKYTRSPFQSPESFLTAWQGQVTRASKSPWLLQQLTTRSTEVFPRFAHYDIDYTHVCEGAQEISESSDDCKPVMLCDSRKHSRPSYQSRRM